MRRISFCDAQDMPFENGEFDLVIALEVMEHVPNTGAFLSEIQRVLQSDGDVIVSVPFVFGEHDFQDYYRWTPQGVEQILIEHGLRVEELKYRGGTGLTILRLAVNYIHSRFNGTRSAWRVKGLARKAYFAIMTIVLMPFMVLSWFAFAFDLMFDAKSVNASGFIFLARKIAKSMTLN